MIRWFKEEADVGEVGGKGRALSAATRAGLPVPAGFCVTADGMGLLESGSFASTLSNAMGILGGTPVAVRSSAVGEDGRDYSFAGMFRTELNVVSTPCVARTLRKIRESTESASVSEYTRRLGLTTPIRMAAVVQTMVFPAVAGVLFTRDPVNGKDHCVVEASWGLGEGVVSGAVTPDHYLISRDNRVTSVTIGNKSVASVPMESGTSWVDLDPRQAHKRCLSGAQLRALTALGRRCEVVFGSPQDIEWALGSASLWLIQSRAITGPCREEAPI